MVEIKTHTRIDRSLSGEPKEISEGYAKVVLKTDGRMAADEKGLVHGGFIFSSADYASMLAVNHPNVVLAEAHVKFLKPVAVGDTLVFEAKVVEKEGKRYKVLVEGNKGDQIVFEGLFLCVVPSRHVLERQ